MKKNTFILIILIFPSIITSCKKDDSQPSHNQTNELVKTFGGLGDDSGSSIQQTSDGGYIIGGGTESIGNGESDMYLIKLDDGGEEQWSRTFGGVGSDYCNSIQQTNDKGFILFGLTWGEGMSLVKVDSTGQEEWYQTFEEYIILNCGYSIQQTSDGGYIMIGDGNEFDEMGNPVSVVYLIKTDSEGEKQWCQKFYGEDTNINYLRGNYVQQTSDGGFILTLTTNLTSILIKTNDSGEEIWSKSGGLGVWNSVKQTYDGGYIIVGNTSGNICLVKTDENGEEEWYQTFGGDGNEWGMSGQQTSDGGFIMVGSTNSFGNGSYDLYIIKTNGLGQEEWYKTYGGSLDDRGLSIQQNESDDFVISGFTNSQGNGGFDVYFIKTDGY